VAECQNGIEAIDAIQGSHPILCSWTCRCPARHGFEVIEAWAPRTMPPVVFVTAYDQYALRAFDVRALDYLLKPFDRERFQQALSRARQRVATQGPGNSSAAARADAGSQADAAPRRLASWSSRGPRSISSGPEEIDWIESAGNYVKLHVAPRRHLLRETMTAIEDAARSRGVLPHPSLPHRQHRAGAGTAAVLQRRVRGVSEERRALTLSRGYRDNSSNGSAAAL
jgi:two-component system LytT family response regulator